MVDILEFIFIFQSRVNQEKEQQMICILCLMGGRLIGIVALLFL